jgi:molybdopterin-guanine dinucleotide biosynthesis protein A
LVPAFVDRIFERLEGREIAVPRENESHHFLSAVYRTSVLTKVERLLGTDRLRLRDLLDETDISEVPVDELRKADPDLRTLENLNNPEAYERALRQEGF